MILQTITKEYLRFPIGLYIAVLGFIVAFLAFYMIPGETAQSAIYSDFTLSFTDSEKDGTWNVTDLSQPTSVVNAPGNNHVYAASSGSNSIILFSRNSFKIRGILLELAEHLGISVKMLRIPSVFCDI